LPVNVDESIFLDFISAQENVFDALEALMMSLEKELDQNKLRDLKGILHTLKGESSLMNLLDVAELCHKLEDYLEEHEKDLLPSFFITANDWCRQKIKFIQGSAEEPENVTTFINKILDGDNDSKESPNKKDKTVKKTPKKKKNTKAKEKVEKQEEKPLPADQVENRIGVLPANVDIDIFTDFLSAQNSVLENLEHATMEFEKDGNSDHFNEINRLLHTLKGESGLMGLSDLGEICHKTEEAIKNINRGKCRIII